MGTRKGRREREAGKRHRRARVYFRSGAESGTLKLGHKKLGIHMCRWLSAETRTPERALEP